MDVLAQLRSALADRYTIEREIGAGGMATVYLARDPRHDRHVALKLLKPELGAVLGVERFLAEIKVTANLQHPNLLPLFDSGEANGLLFYVMPFVEGESLRARLDREKQLPVDEAVRIAVACANALDYAHGHGVIHRDLKPENILLQHGQPVVADFGIALAVSNAGGNRITQTGLSLGTPQYMSPEQATGDRVIDGRSDIYSLAALTYEMLTGEPPHIGHTAQAVIARVLTDKPRPIRSTRSAVPEHVEAALERALEKLPADRFSTAREFGDALQGKGALASGSRAATGASGRAPRGWRARLSDPVVLALAAVAAGSLGTAGMLWKGRAPDVAGAERVIRFAVTAPEGVTLRQDLAPWPVTLSSDGSRVVFGAVANLEPALWLLRTDELLPQMIPGTEGSTQQPLLSPDGETLLFEPGGKEAKVRLDGSSKPVIIAGDGNANGVDWISADDIVYGSSGTMHGLSIVSATGGERKPLTSVDTSTGVADHLWPIVAPDANTIALSLWKGSLPAGELALTTVKSGTITPLGVPGIRPLVFLDGYLVYLQHDGAVMAIKINFGGRKVVGRPIQVHDRVRVETANNGNSSIFISRGGALAVSDVAEQAKLAWAGKSGAHLPIAPESKPFMEPRISPDGARIAVINSDAGTSDIWIFDLRQKTLSRLTSVGSVSSAVWADSTHIVYAASGKTARIAAWRLNITGAQTPELLFEIPALATAVELSRDGRTVYFQGLIDGMWRLASAPVGSTAPPRTLVGVGSSTMAGRLSRDGRLLSYASAQTGRMEVYLHSLTDSVTIQVSAGGGRESAWSADGKTVFYQAGRRIVAARLRMSPRLSVVSRDTVFSLDGAATNSPGFGANWDVGPDGRLLVLQTTQAAKHFVVSPNWIVEFRERIRAATAARD